MAQSSTSALVTVKPSAPHAEKPKKFKGDDFKHWQQKMLFYLTTLNLAHILKEDCLVMPQDKQTKEIVSATEAWKHSDFLCRNYILNGLVDSLYNVYASIQTSKLLWESLEKYKIEDVGTKKFIVGKFLDFKMNDSRPVINQMEELQIVINDIHAEGMVVNESFKVVAIIEKLPPSWKDFKNYLKHKRKEL